MHKQEYQGLILLTPSTQGNHLTDGQHISQRLYVKKEDVAKWREITQAERDQIVEQHTTPREPHHKPAPDKPPPAKKRSKK